ncbi:GAF domain-containing protein (plasmid) [Bradyrhizobium sp. PMVTL-01]|uniref:GAF domain-containing protein n=1 Tax=Bradyrhizobium sp. PMVTL-01 TaxID=3434999 RepID=UPI003F711BB4
MREAREQQAATTDILKVIASSPSDVQPVFDAIAARANRLVGGLSTAVFSLEGEVLHLMSFTSVNATGDSALKAVADMPLTAYPVADAIIRHEVSQIADTECEGIPDFLRHVARERGWRSALTVPIVYEKQLAGTIAVTRAEPGLFHDHHVRLLITFAEQAAIAIENVRLFNATKDALEQQRAIASILSVINAGGGDLSPIFESILDHAHRLCGAPCGSLQLYRDGRVQPVAIRGMTPELAAFLRAGYPITEGIRESLMADRPLQILDLAEVVRSRPDEPSLRAAVELGGIHTMTTVPLAKDGVTFGRIVAARQEVRRFEDKQIALLQSFAAQAVTAIENARLFNEVQAKTHGLEEALRQQTATADVLKVISRSTLDVQPVFEVIAQNAVNLCEAERAFIFRYDGQMLHAVAHCNAGPEVQRFVYRNPITPGRQSISARAALERRTIHIADVQVDRDYTYALNDVSPIRTLLAVPMLKGSELVGVITSYRLEIKPFSNAQIELMEAFASQAVIAIENARLFEAVQTKTQDLEEALQHQTSSANILNVIASSPTDVRPVMEAIVESACRVCGAYDSVALLKEGDDLLFTAHYGPIPMHSRKRSINPRWTAGRAFIEKRAIHVHDLQAEQDEFPEGMEMAREMGHRTIVSVPLLREGQSIGALVLRRLEVNPFSEKQIALLQTFADQAVIAIENTRLFNETKESLERQTATAEVLKVIASSPSDVQPVFDAIVGSAAELFDPCAATIVTLSEGRLHWAATAASISGFDVEQARTIYPIPFDPQQIPSARAIIERRIVEIPDVDAPNVSEVTRRVAAAGGFRAMTFVPLLDVDQGIGTIVFTSPERGFRFGERQLALIQTFADQAVIAIQNARHFNTTRESLERQTATAEILRVIASSPSDVQPVFDAIAASANRLLGGLSTAVLRFVEGEVHLASFTSISHEADAVLNSHFPAPLTAFAPFEAAARGELVQIADADATENEEARQVARARGYRSFLLIPLLNAGRAVGAIGVTRATPGAFSPHHMQLLQTFADQAVIAIENVRLFNETKEALAHQTATSEVLQAIGSSMADTKPVFERILDSVEHLFEILQCSIMLNPGDGLVHLAARRGVGTQLLDQLYPVPLAQTMAAEILRTRHQTYFPDARYGSQLMRRVAETAGDFSMVMTPMVWAGTSIGVLNVSRAPNAVFSEKELGLLKTFADQAVIAIKNTQLFNETQEALQQQTATAEVLKVIASSPTDVQPVLRSIVESACELCEAMDAVVLLRDGDHLRFSAHHGPIPINVERWPIGRNWVAGRAFVDQVTVHVTDIFSKEADEYSASRELTERAGSIQIHSVLAVPLLREDESIGAILLRRQEKRSFEEKQISLLQTFADQAVIAIGNVRLFEQVQQRTRELSESLQQQVATSEILQIISSSPGELDPVFQSILANATRLCEAECGVMWLREGDDFRSTAIHGPLPLAYVEQWRSGTPVHPGPHSPLAILVQSRKAVHVPDMREDPSYLERHSLPVAAVEVAGIRTLLLVPMSRETELVGGIAIYRQEVRPFSDKQVALVENFAAQAVIAIENARLLNELRQRTDDLSRSLENLRNAQDRLVQTEKMASLGQLTAGIAHEIKNPLNFVNNFSQLSVELVEEMTDLFKTPALDEAGRRKELDEIRELLKSNLEKVVQHGKRADSIVKNMLLHSREGSTERRSTDINKLVEESLSLAYHGARAEKPGFTITLKHDLDPEAGALDLYPQDMTRALLNLISNGFYAATQRKAEMVHDAFEPILCAATRNLGDVVQIRIRDNGAGIPPELKEKIFNPFFTTKPTGEGTGLGLSMTHDIVVKQHGGRIDVETEPAAFAEFIITLPRG